MEAARTEEGGGEHPAQEQDVPARSSGALLKTRGAPLATTPLVPAPTRTSYGQLPRAERMRLLRAGAGAALGLAAVAATTHKAVRKTASAAHAHPIAATAALLAGASAAVLARQRLRALREQMQEDWASAPFQVPLHQQWPQRMRQRQLPAVVRGQARDSAVRDVSGSAWIAPLSQCNSKRLSKAAVAYLMEAPCAPRPLTADEVFDLATRSLYAAALHVLAEAGIPQAQVPTLSAGAYQSPTQMRLQGSSDSLGMYFDLQRFGPPSLRIWLGQGRIVQKTGGDLRLDVLAAAAVPGPASSAVATATPFEGSAPCHRSQENDARAAAPPFTIFLLDDAIASDVRIQLPKSETAHKELLHAVLEDLVAFDTPPNRYPIMRLCQRSCGDAEAEGGRPEESRSPEGCALEAIADTILSAASKLRGKKLQGLDASHVLFACAAFGPDRNMHVLVPLQAHKDKKQMHVAGPPDVNFSLAVLESREGRSSWDGSYGAVALVCFDPDDTMHVWAKPALLGTCAIKLHSLWASVLRQAATPKKLLTRGLSSTLSAVKSGAETAAGALATAIAPDLGAMSPDQQHAYLHSMVSSMTYA